MATGNGVRFCTYRIHLCLAEALLAQVLPARREGDGCLSWDSGRLATEGRRRCHFGGSAAPGVYTIHMARGELGTWTVQANANSWTQWRTFFPVVQKRNKGGDQARVFFPGHT